MAVKLTIDIKLNSQSIANNTSNVTVNVNATWSSGSYNLNQKNGWVKIDGTQYNFTSDLNPNRKTSGVSTLYSKTVNISHASDGKKAFDCSALYNCNLPSATNVEAGVKDYALPTIPRKSTLSVGNGTLGKPQTLTVTEQASSFTHTITAKCGSASTTICTKSTSNSISFTPPLSWASQNTTGTSVSVTYTITTYNGSTSVGSNTYTKTCSIPASVKPSCSISVSDPTGTADTYEFAEQAYVEGVSKFKVVVTPTTSYGSPIASYKTTANGATYTTATFTTGTLSSSGMLTIKATVTDKRGRSGSAEIKVNVWEYSKPIISKLSVGRCSKVYDENGNDTGEYVANDIGDWAQVTCSASVTDVGDSQRCELCLYYKKASEASWTGPISLAYDDIAPTNKVYRFEAESGSSYDVKVVMEDVLGNTTSRTAVISTAFTLMHWGADGRSMGIGKVAELEDGLDIGLKTRFTGGISYIVLPPGANIGAQVIPGFYVGHNVSSNGYTDCPITSGTFTLEVKSAGPSGQLWQILTVCDKTISATYERFYYGSAWGDWVCTSDFGGKLLWQGVYYMSANQTVTLAEPVSFQNNGIVLVFSRYSSGTAQNYHFNHAFVHKAFVKLHPGVGNTFLMTTDGSFSVMATKYIYIHDDHIDGNAINEATGTGTSGVKYENNGFVLRYVIGV